MHLLVLKSGDYLVVPRLSVEILNKYDLKAVINVFETYEFSINNDLLTIKYANLDKDNIVVVDIKNECVGSILHSIHSKCYKSLEDVVKDILPMY